MASVNKVILVGNLGGAPEVRYTQSGQAVASFNLATNERWKGKDGQMQEKTEWHKIVAWGKQAENCGQYLNKGSPVYIEGRLQTREWEDKNGGGKRYTTEVLVQSIQFLGSGQGKGQGRGDSGQTYQENGSPATPPAAGPVDDDVPF